MSKSKFCKLLSVVLAVAICCTALCGSIIAVNAANADYTCTYTVTVGDQNNAVPFGSTKVKAQVKFDLPAGFGGGDFTVSLKDTKGNDIYSSISDAKVTAATPKDSGVSFDAKSSNCFINNGNQVEFLLGDGDLYTSATIEYTYNMSSYVNSNPGNTYPTTITNIKLAVEHDYATVNVTAASDSDASFHAHSAWLPDNTPKTEFTSADENHKVVSDSKCATCGQNDSEHKQVHPNYLTFDGATEPGSVLNTGWIGLSGTTVDYNSDGTLYINVHGYTQYQSGTLVILVTDENGKEYYRSSDKQTSTFAGNGFNADEFMVNINNFSAKNIDKKLLITAVAINSNKVCYSRTEEFTLTDYCTDVIDENAVWADGTTDAQKTADKEVAASLLYYGASIDESVFNKTTTAPEDTTIKGTTTVTPVEKSSDKWEYNNDLNNADSQWGFSDSNILLLNPDVANSEENPYVIETAEQLAYIALYAGDVTAGNYYKVSDNVKEFVLAPSSSAAIDNSTFDNLKTSLLSAAKYSEYNGGTYKYWTSSYTHAFQGHFDGNGVVIRGLTTKENCTNAVALFPYVKGDVSFKNITLTDSYLSTEKNAGGIIGTSATVNSSNYSTITSLEFENCVVKGNYFEMTNTNATVEDNYSVGGLTGAVRCVTNNVTVSNCVVVDNKTEMSNSGTAYAFFGSIAQAGNANYSFKNSISDLSVWTIASTVIIDKAENYTNVYTTVTIPKDEISDVTDANVKTIEKASMKGANALTTMNLSSTDWFATESGYPELRVFHSLQNIYTDDLSHTPTCAIKINGVACTVCGVTESHTMADNSDGTYSICSACGYGEKKITYTTTVTPVEKSIVKWGGTDSDKPKTLQESGMKGSGDSEEDPYIIETAAQLFYVVQHAGDDSINKFYKISDSVAVVDFNNGNLGLADNNKHFKGTFDGNGVTIKNLKISGYHAALFPNVSGNATIKNLKVDTASLTATSGNAGGLIANINGDGNTNITVSNCIIINSTVTVNDTGGAGIIVGTAGNGPYLTIENCFVSGNTATASSSYQSNSLICVGWQTNNYALNNTIVIGSNPTNRINNFNNVSTDYEMESSINGITQLTTQQMQGANALTTMNLSSTDWFATESGYPELRVFHSLQNIYTDDLSHTPTCAIKINGVACTVCGVAEQHTAGDCSCGYKSTVVPSISELLTQKYDSTVSGKVLTVLNANKTYTNKFESNTKFVSAYTADTNPTDCNSNLYLYASSLNLKTLPYIVFTFVLLGDNATNLSNVKIKFTCGETTKEITGDDLIHNQGAGVFYAYRFKELPIVNLKDQVTVTVNGNNFGSYSAAGYAISAINYGSDYFYYAQASKAIVLYSEMLSARKSVYA